MALTTSGVLARSSAAIFAGVSAGAVAANESRMTWDSSIGDMVGVRRSAASTSAWPIEPSRMAAWEPIISFAPARSSYAISIVLMRQASNTAISNGAPWLSIA